MNLIVNGTIHLVDADPSTRLLHVMRNDAGLRGANFGCGSRNAALRAKFKAVFGCYTDGRR